MAFIFFIFSLIVAIKSEKNHDSMNNNRDLQSEEFSNIRIYIDANCLISSESTTNNRIINSSINIAKETIEKLVKVKRLDQPIILNNYNIPNDLNQKFKEGGGCYGNLNQYFFYDLIIFIRRHDSTLEGSVDFASSEIIKFVNNDENERPLIGAVSYGLELDKLEAFGDDESKLQALSTIFLHEFTHILGFNKTILQKKNLIKSEIKNNTRLNLDEQNIISFIGSKAVKKAQEYFNCPRLQSIELDVLNGKENKDNNSIHWNARILLGDYMIAELYYSEQAISEITLALLEDLGWYEVNYYTGGLMRFGKNEGCEFLENDCMKYNDMSNTDSSFSNEFCSYIFTITGINNHIGTCSSGRQSMTYCFNTYSYGELSQNDNNYLRNSIYGYSNLKLLEYCPISYDVNYASSTPRLYYSGNCKYGKGKYGEFLTFLKGASSKLYSTISSHIYEKYNYSSFCAFSSLINPNDTSNPNYIKGILRPTCYEMSCSEKSLTIQVGDEFIVCPQQGGPIKLEAGLNTNYSGILICPDYNLICTGTVVCNNIFDCAEKNSTVKNNTYNYNYTQNEDVSIEIKSSSESSITNIITEEIYELGDDGICPKYCQQCNSNGQCSICNDKFHYYVGTKEGDNEAINCTDKEPGLGYYKKSINNKDYYFKCVDNCDLCFENNKTVCTQCIPSHYINSSDGQCYERIPGCIKYDETKTKPMDDNGGARSYYECLDCNNTDKYFCFDMNKEACNKTPNINLSLYYEMEPKNYSCIQRCDGKYLECDSCNIDKCTVCKQEKHFVNKFGNCIKEIEHCKDHYQDLNYSSCEYCNEDDDYYCLNENRNSCEYISPGDYAHYYKNENNKNSCVELCNKTYSDLCIGCNNSYCTECKDNYYVNEVGHGFCLKTIEHCNSYYKKVNYSSCDLCDERNNYYCLNDNRAQCKYIPTTDRSFYYQVPNTDNLNPCLKLCNATYSSLCIGCNSTRCTKCISGYYANQVGEGFCFKEIDKCITHELTVNYSSCSICDENSNYYCINDNRTICRYIPTEDYKFYYKMTNDAYSCVKLCNATYNNLCSECNNTQCTKCIEGYFLYNGTCIENITGCIDNIVESINPRKITCDLCNNETDYYCLNENKTICNYMNESEISEYYLLPNINYPCYSHCNNVVEDCIKCNRTHCFKCGSGLAVDRTRKNCIEPPKYFAENVKCNVTIHQVNSSLDTNLNFFELAKNYFRGLDHISKVEHYVGTNYTMTLFINSNCTEGLLPQGYYKLDTRELNKTIIEEAELDMIYHLLGVYINNNYRSYISFYDTEEYEDQYSSCRTCLDKSYKVIHNLYNILNTTIGKQFTEFIFDQGINIFDENDDIYTDTCTNLTIYKIDIPINLRKNYLFLHEYYKPLLCHDVECELIEINLTNRTSTCQCKMGNIYQDIFQESNIEFVPYKSDVEAKGISEAAKVIKCMKKGIKYKFFKNNEAAIFILIAFILQVCCYVAYGCFGKPLNNVSNIPTTLANPPKGDAPTKIYLFSDWDINLSNDKKDGEAKEEEEKVIQPRDDSGDQIMEEEKSLNNDFFSDISIDTNAGGLFQDKKTNRSLRTLDKNKKVLILLGNKTKKKVSLEHSINREIISDSDEVPLSRFKKSEKVTFFQNYWMFLSIKQHIINYFSDITCCNMTESYIPLPLRFVRSIFIIMLCIIISILWLDQKYFEKKWEHFNDKYSIVYSTEKKIEIPLGERTSYALGHNFGYIIVNLILLTAADFIIGFLFFNLREETENILRKSKMSQMQDLVLKARRNYNIFYVINFILIVVFFLSLSGFGVTYTGGIVDCLSVALLSLLLLEILPFIWSLILALMRYFGYKKKKNCLISVSEFFLF